jgi:hypothetical protein
MTEPDPEMVAKLQAEHKALQEGILEITAAWAAIETDMAGLLRDILADPTGDVAFAIYFSPASSEVRFRIVDAGYCGLMGETRLKASDFERLIAPWRVFMDKLNRAKELRNAVAHGTIGTIGAYGKTHVRLVPPIFNFRRIFPSVQKRQLAGLSGHDITTGAKNMWSISEKAALFGAIARARHGSDDEALRKAILAAEASLMTSAPQPAAPKKPKRHTQPRQSRAARRKAALARLGKG